MNKHWPRWIVSSVAQHFAARDDIVLISNENDITRTLADGNLPLFVEGQNRRSREIERLLELRIDGPSFVQQTKDKWQGIVIVNALIQIGQPTSDLWTLQRAQGIVATAFTDILIYKYGPDTVDTGDLLGCLKLIQNDLKGDLIEINNFGPMTNDAELQQSAIEGKYKIDLES
jgi:hypothetical protein